MCSLQRIAAPPAHDLFTSLSLFGGHKAVARPVPIPNTAVKHSLADGSGPIGSARVGCRQIISKSRDALKRISAFLFPSVLAVEHRVIFDSSAVEVRIASPPRHGS